MNKELLKKSLLPGIAGGLVIAFGTILARMWISGISLKDSLVSPLRQRGAHLFPDCGRSRVLLRSQAETGEKSAGAKGTEVKPAGSRNCFTSLF